jgi:hypothetical protein
MVVLGTRTPTTEWRSMRPTVRDQAEQLHGSGPLQETSVSSLVPDPRLSDSQDL